MATQIVDQIIEYDNSTRAWARYQDGELRKYYDDQQSAILAALPHELREWVENIARRHPRLGKRPLKAAVIIATNRVQPSARFDQFYDVLGDSGTTYQVNVSARVCSCEDNRHGHYCKHLLAARYIERQKGQGLTLWELAQAAIKEHEKDEELRHLEIWRDPTSTRRAALVRRQSNHTAERMPCGCWLHLIVSGYPLSLRVAEQATHMLDGSSFWRWNCKRSDYQKWVRQHYADSRS